MATAATAVQAQPSERKSSQPRRQEPPRITGEAWRQIVYQGPVRRCFFTSSRSFPGMERRVYLDQDGSLICDCISAHYRGTCAHKTVVAAALAEEAKRIARAHAAAEEEAERGWKLTAKGRSPRKRPEGTGRRGRARGTSNECN